MSPPGKRALLAVCFRRSGRPSTMVSGSPSGASCPGVSRQRTTRSVEREIEIAVVDRDVVGAARAERRRARPACRRRRVSRNARDAAAETRRRWRHRGRRRARRRDAAPAARRSRRPRRRSPAASLRPPLSGAQSGAAADGEPARPRRERQGDDGSIGTERCGMADRAGEERQVSGTAPARSGANDAPEGKWPFRGKIGLGSEGAKWGGFRGKTAFPYCKFAAVVYCLSR